MIKTTTTKTIKPSPAATFFIEFFDKSAKKEKLYQIKISKTSANSVKPEQRMILKSQNPILLAAFHNNKPY